MLDLQADSRFAKLVEGQSSLGLGFYGKVEDGLFDSGTLEGEVTDGCSRKLLKVDQSSSKEGLANHLVNS